MTYARVRFEGQDPDFAVDAGNADESAADGLDLVVAGGTLATELAPATAAGISPGSSLIGFSPTPEIPATRRPRGVAISPPLVDRRSQRNSFDNKRRTP